MIDELLGVISERLLQLSQGVALDHARLESFVELNHFDTDCPEEVDHVMGFNVGRQVANL
jgi:hypothetical protein